MSVPFRTLQEFTEMREGELSFPRLEASMGKMDLGKLLSVLAKTPWGRFLAVKRWLKEVGRVCDKKIRLKVSFSSHTPYMRENGTVGLCRKDFQRQRYLFFAVAHETAHFLLMCDEDYPLLKALEREYLSCEGDGALRSPIEFCANRIMMTLFERCVSAAKDQRTRDVAVWCMECFEEQLRETSSAFRAGQPDDGE